MKVLSLVQIIGHELYQERHLPKKFAVSVSEVALSFETDRFNQDQQRQIVEFIKNNPDFYFSAPYQGYCLYMFKTKPETFKCSKAQMFHRGGRLEINVNGVKVLVIADLD